jgi:hypothetical protein
LAPAAGSSSSQAVSLPGLRESQMRSKGGGTQFIHFALSSCCCSKSLLNSDKNTTGILPQIQNIFRPTHDRVLVTPRYQVTVTCPFHQVACPPVQRTKHDGGCSANCRKPSKSAIVSFQSLACVIVQCVGKLACLIGEGALFSTPALRTLSRETPDFHGLHPRQHPPQQAQQRQASSKE